MAGKWLGGGHTLVNKLELGDDVQANLGEFILQHLQEHGEQVVDSPSKTLAWLRGLALSHHHLLLLAQNRSQAANLGAQRGTNVLGRV
jgi:hypothetical protein